jgi:hypothetical protein
MSSVYEFYIIVYRKKFIMVSCFKYISHSLSLSRFLNSKKF